MNPPPTVEKNWRYYLGVSLFWLAMGMPLFSFFILPLDLPAGIKAAIVGFFSLGGPEVALIASAALLGKNTLNAFKGRIFSAVRRLAARPASRFRYYTCLAIMVGVHMGWYPYGYFPDDIPDLFKERSWLIAWDVAFILAFLTAGPEFWEKIRRIFSWEGSLQDAR